MEEQKQFSTKRPKASEQKNEIFTDAPDQIEEVKILSIEINPTTVSCFLTFDITPPDCNNSQITEYLITLFTLKKTSQTPQIKFEIPFQLLEQQSSCCIVPLEFNFTCRNALGVSPSKKQKYQLRKFIKNGHFAISGQGQYNQFNLDAFPEEIVEDLYDQQTNTISEFIEIPTFQEIANEFTVNQSAFVITNDGSLIQWGFSIDNDENNNIIELSSSHFTPEFPTKEFIVNVVCGQNAAIATTFTGQCFSWGMNEFGQLGLCDKIARINPTLISLLKDKFIKQVSFSYFHALAMTDDGSLYVWGKSQAIAGKEIMNSYEECVDFENAFIDQIGPRLVDTGKKCTAISTGLDFSMFITQECINLFKQQYYLEELYSWGNNTSNQLGIQFPELAQKVTHISIPRKVDISQPVLDISCGFSHTLLLVSGGQLWSFGKSKHGQCGHGDYGHRLFPTTIQSVKKIKFIKISAGMNHSLALSQDNQLFAFGSNKLHQFGDISNNEENILSPVVINSFISSLKDCKILGINAKNQISSIFYAKL